MSEQSPQIRVTRGSKPQRRRRSPSTGRRSFDVDASGPLGLVSGVIRGARTAWWVGLGVLSVAQDVGTKAFDALVEKGKTWKETQRERLDDRVHQLQEITRRERGLAGDVEQRIRSEVRAILRGIDVPHRDDFEELHAQVDRLREEVGRLAQTVEEMEGDESPF